MMRDILQSRYLRRRVAHKQLARTSLKTLKTAEDIAHAQLETDNLTKIKPINKSTRFPLLQLFKHLNNIKPSLKFRLLWQVKCTDLQEDDDSAGHKIILD